MPALLADLVATSQAVGATSKRKEKTELLGAYLAELLPGADDDPHQATIAVGLLVGEPRQGRIGVGWSAVSKIDAAPAAEPSLTLADVDHAIAELQATSGPGSVARRAGLLTELFSSATEVEVDFLKRLFVGEVRQGALGGLLADAIAKANGVPAKVVRRAAMLSGDLGTTAAVAATEGRSGLEAIGLTVGTAIQPMLASTSATVAEALAETGEASVEWKLDGARIQVHREGDAVRIFTRNLNDITERLPTVVETVRALPVASVVLDGEVLAYGADDRPEAFQDTMSSVSRDTGDTKKSLQPFFFDIVHVDGRDLLDLPLGERLSELQRVAGDFRLPAVTTVDPAVGERALAEALEAGHEGAMVKSIDSLYQAGRRGKSWRKVKPVHTLDLVVLAVERGHGRRTGWWSNLHLGARDGDEFVMVGKTFKGLTDELLRWQTENFPTQKASEDDWTLYLKPHFVVEVALDGVQASSKYPGGVALRFARVRHYRPDKSPQDADTIQTVQSLRKP